MQKFINLFYSFKKLSTMKKYFSSILFAIICGMFIASCGGGSGKKLASNDYLGDLPNLVYQKHISDSVFKEKLEAEVSKAKLAGKFNEAKAMQIYEKYKIADKEANKKYDADVEAIKAKLVGKAIPFEVEEGLGYKVISCKISDVKSGTVNAEFELEIIDAKEANVSRWGKPSVSVRFHNIDKEGNILGSEYGSSAYVELSGKDDGSTGKGIAYISFYAKNAAEYANFAKIKFFKK